MPTIGQCALCNSSLQPQQQRNNFQLCIVCDDLQQLKFFDLVLTRIHDKHENFNSVQQFCRLILPTLEKFPFTFEPVVYFDRDKHHGDDAAQSYIELCESLR
ncbi:unnamed protein product, partial [Didymodactylos carnosus]